MFEIATTNLRTAREKEDPEYNHLPTKLQPGDTVLVENHTKRPFDPKYIGDYRVVAIRGNQIEIRPSVGGPREMKHVKYIPPADGYIKQLPSYDTFGRKSTFRLNPDKIPDLQWNLANSYHTKSIGLTIPSTTVISTHYIDVSTLSYAKGDEHNIWCGMSLSNNVTTVQSNTRTITSSVIICTKYTT